mgnify:CR=1 FL=1
MLCILLTFSNTISPPAPPTPYLYPPQSKPIVIGIDNKKLGPRILPHPLPSTYLILFQDTTYSPPGRAPVKSYAEHAVLVERGDEHVLVLAALAKFGQRRAYVHHAFQLQLGLTPGKQPICLSNIHYSVQIVLQSPVFKRNNLHSPTTHTYNLYLYMYIPLSLYFFSYLSLCRCLCISTLYIFMYITFSLPLYHSPSVYLSI